MLKAISGVALALLVGAGALAVRLPAGEETLGSYATSLRGRTRSQRYNASRAARALQGARIRPGQVFSFNQRVGQWTASGGYRKAPVSYGGELVRAFGGGVCQTSTTLYNAALVAGLDVVERHQHVRPPTYVSPGRDAAVAQPGVDLRLRNPYPQPVTLETRVVGDSLVISVRGCGPRRAVAVHTEVQELRQAPVVRGVAATNRGMPGFTALTYVSEGKETRRRLSQNSYPPVARLEP